MGNIFAQMFGQKCQRCMDERFESPMWYPEEVTKVPYDFYLSDFHGLSVALAYNIFRFWRIYTPE